jgi:predicted O-linked N-acetylglucosamine transferase (SPINDLY family)
LSRAEYLARINQVDLALDPFPFNGHTTTCDCLWQGVPVVTLSGTTYRSRFGGSGLATLGLNDWIATSAEQYSQIAVARASDLTALAQLRCSLRDRMAGSPLLDQAGFTRRLEAAYRRMWTRWCGSP